MINLEMGSLAGMFFLSVGAADDLLFKKFHNFLFVCFFLVALVLNFYYLNSPIATVTGSLLCCCVCFIPTVMLNILGAGDFKLALCVSVFLNYQSTFNFFILSLGWGAFIGVIKLGLELLKNRTAFADTLKKNKVPFAVAMLLAFLTLQNNGGLL